MSVECLDPTTRNPASRLQVSHSLQDLDYYSHRPHQNDGAYIWRHTEEQLAKCKCPYIALYTLLLPPLSYANFLKHIRRRYFSDSIAISHCISSRRNIKEQLCTLVNKYFVYSFSSSILPQILLNLCAGMLI